MFTLKKNKLEKERKKNKEKVFIASSINTQAAHFNRESLNVFKISFRKYILLWFCQEHWDENKENEENESGTKKQERSERKKRYNF